MHSLFLHYFATMRKAALCLFFFLGSCVRVGNYRSHCISLESTDFSQNVSEAASTLSFRFEEEAPWWDIFGDPQLEELISQAVACHPSVKEASEKIALAVEESKLVRSTLFPHFNFDVNLSRQKLSSTNTLYSRVSTLFTELTINALSFFWNLDIWGKNLSLYLAQMSQTQAAIADKFYAELLISLAVAEAYFDYQSTLARLELAQEKIGAYQQLSTILKERFSHAITSEIPLLELDVRIAAVKEFIAQLEMEREIARHALAAFTTNSCEVGFCGIAIIPSFPLLTAAFPLPCNLPLDLLARRPEILSQRWWIESASFTVDAAVANFYPNINLLGYFGLDTTDMGRLFQGKSLNILAKSALSLPLFDAGQRCANLGIAKETLEIAIQEYNQLVLDAIVEVSDWFSLLEMADKKWKIQSGAIAESEKLYLLENERFKHAIRSLIPVLEAKIIALDQKDIGIEIQLTKLKAAAGLVKALGGPYG